MGVLTSIDSVPDSLSLNDMVKSFMERLSLLSSLNNVEEVEELRKLEEDESELEVDVWGEFLLCN